MRMWSSSTPRWRRPSGKGPPRPADRAMRSAHHGMPDKHAHARLAVFALVLRAVRVLTSIVRRTLGALCPGTWAALGTMASPSPPGERALDRRKSTLDQGAPATRSEVHVPPLVSPRPWKIRVTRYSGSQPAPRQCRNLARAIVASSSTAPGWHWWPQACPREAVPAPALEQLSPWLQTRSPSRRADPARSGEPSLMLPTTHWRLWGVLLRTKFQGTCSQQRQRRRGGKRYQCTTNCSPP